MIERIDRPLDLAALAADLDEPMALLESGGPAGPNSRFSMLAIDPSAEILATEQSGDVLDTITELLASRRRPPLPQIPFAGGLVGYLGYELLHEVEPTVPRSPAPPLGPPVVHLLACDTVICVDRLDGCSWISSPPGLIERARGLAAAAPPAESAPQVAAPTALHAEELMAAVVSDTTAAGYRAMVEQAKERIRAGDVFELCITRRFDATNPVGHSLHEAVRALTPAPMSALLRLGDGTEVISASPERLVRLTADGVAETRPIKGTRPRSLDPARDADLARDLARTEKDRAEHVMIVDVARNDLGRVCTPGSIEVTELGAIEAHPSVWQMVSTVRGRLRSECGPVDLVRAVFPAASMTGAPKIQAMKLISAMERSRRGIYSGAIGYIDDGGAMDLSVVIRALVRSGGRVTLHAGGAITADSDPQAEERETLDKAAALIAALSGSRA